MGGQQKHLARIDDMNVRAKAARMVATGENLCPCGRIGRWQMIVGMDVFFRCDRCRSEESRTPARPPAPPAATIGELMTSGPGWFWCYCLGGPQNNCWRQRPMRLQQFADLWGEDASSDLIRERLVCSKCGHKGAQIIMPSSDGLGRRSAFPADAEMRGAAVSS